MKRPPPTPANSPPSSPPSSPRKYEPEHVPPKKKKLKTVEPMFIPCLPTLPRKVSAPDPTPNILENYHEKISRLGSDLTDKQQRQQIQILDQTITLLLLNKSHAGSDAALNLLKAEVNNLFIYPEFWTLYAETTNTLNLPKLTIKAVQNHIHFSKTTTLKLQYLYANAYFQLGNYTKALNNIHQIFYPLSDIKDIKLRKEIAILATYAALKSNNLDEHHQIKEHAMSYFPHSKTFH